MNSHANHPVSKPSNGKSRPDIPAMAEEMIIPGRAGSAKNVAGRPVNDIMSKWYAITGNVVSMAVEVIARQSNVVA